MKERAEQCVNTFDSIHLTYTMKTGNIQDRGDFMETACHCRSFEWNLFYTK